MSAARVPDTLLAFMDDAAAASVKRTFPGEGRKAKGPLITADTFLSAEERSAQKGSEFFLQSTSGTINIDVGGVVHRVKIKHFRKASTIPSSRLGRLFRYGIVSKRKSILQSCSRSSRAKNLPDVLRNCDKFTAGDPPTVFFDRNSAGFNTILDIYRTDMLHFTEKSCALVMKHDFDYWGIDEMMLEPCCALKERTLPWPRHTRFAADAEMAAGESFLITLLKRAYRKKVPPEASCPSSETLFSIMLKKGKILQLAVETHPTMQSKSQTASNSKSFSFPAHNSFRARVERGREKRVRNTYTQYA